MSPPEPRRSRAEVVVEELDPRSQELWRLHDFSIGRGLEIGPLHDAILKRQQTDVRYVDITDREALRRYYGTHPGIPINDIPEIDYPLTQPDGRIVSLAEATRRDAPFDWVMASHVVEHVPDLIGWLADLAEVVVDNGALVLVIPDRRYTFDAHRPPTSVGAMLEAHELRADRPGVRAVYDHYSRAVHADVLELWQGRLPAYSARYHGAQEALLKAAESVSGSYVDCHVWLFEPEEFIEQIHELRLLGQCSWYIDRLRTTTENTLEYMVRMRRIRRTDGIEASIDDELLASNNQPPWLRPEFELRRNLEKMEAHIDSLTARCATLGQTVDHQARRIAAQRSRLAAKNRRLELLAERLKAKNARLARVRRELAAQGFRHAQAQKRVTLRARARATLRRLVWWR